MRTGRWVVLYGCPGAQLQTKLRNVHGCCCGEVTDGGWIDQGSELLETGAGELRTSESVLELMAIRSARI